ncbi:MAG: ATP-binding cassette domain-containing protein, partial [Methanobacterium sp.]
IHFWRDTVEEELSLNFLEKFEDNNSSKFRKLREYMYQNSHETINSNNNEMILDSEKEELIEFFGISQLRDKHPYDCSGGEKQKIAIIKALLTKPDILFLDEPTKGLDPVSKLHLAYKLKKLQKNGLTIVMATHDIEFAAEYSKRCMILFDGKIQIDSTPKAVFSSNNFYTTFVNRMVKNFLPESITLNDVKEKWIN